MYMLYVRPAVYTSNSVGHLVREGLVDAVFHGGDIRFIVYMYSVI